MAIPLTLISGRGIVCGWGGSKKNEFRHSRGGSHSNHIINNTKTNNQRVGGTSDQLPDQLGRKGTTFFQCCNRM